MSTAREQFGRWRLAKSRWKCEPQEIPAGEKAAFEQAWRRQRFLEQTVVQQARDLSVTDDLLQRIDHRWQSYSLRVRLAVKSARRWYVIMR